MMNARKRYVKARRSIGGFLLFSRNHLRTKKGARTRRAPFSFQRRLLRQLVVHALYVEVQAEKNLVFSFLTSL